MKMVNRIALQHLKYYRSKNILIGIAIFLATVLLFLIPTVGSDIISLQFALNNELSPNYHAYYYGIQEETVQKLSAHHDIAEYGLRSDVGSIVASDADILLAYFDEKAYEFNHLALEEGSLPEGENEIVLSKGILKELEKTGEVGDTISVSFQVYRDGFLDYAQEKEFVISGLVKEGGNAGEEQKEDTEDKKMYTAFVSKAFLDAEIPQGQAAYSFLFRVETGGGITTDGIVDTVNDIAGQMNISENKIYLNGEYLMGNYVDPSFLAAIIVIMGIVILAGVITLYSIYYIGMPQRIQELGRIRSIGATKRQLKQIILREGIAVAGIAIPIALLAGSLLTGLIIRFFVRFLEMGEILQNGDVRIFHPSLYFLAAAVTLFMVWLSLLKPMRIAAKVSEIEAIRQQVQAVKPGRKHIRKSLRELSVLKLAGIFTLGNKRNALVTVISMSMTGIFTIVLATILSCANPTDSANNEIYGQYQIANVTEEGNKEHPERQWGNVIKNNSLDDTLIKQLEGIKGVTGVSCFQEIQCPDSELGYYLDVLGAPEECSKELLRGIVQGEATAEQLDTGHYAIVNKLALQWYPELTIGKKIQIEIPEGESSRTMEVEIIAIGDYPIGFSRYNSLLMTSTGIQKLCSYNTNMYLSIFAEKKEDKRVTEEITELVKGNDILKLSSWQESYNTWRSTFAFMDVACYIFLGILGAICIMNIINTMVHSVHVRKKELGMIQAIGMSDSQLTKMLQMEGLFYTATTLVVSVGLGSLLGYPAYLWARENKILSVDRYHYPAAASIVIAVVLLVIQMVLAVSLGRAAKRESLIERIRHSE